MESLKSKFKIEDSSSANLHNLNILSKIDGNLSSNLSKKQVKFLLEIWKFLTNKKTFNMFFTKLFNKTMDSKEIMELDELFDLSIEESSKVLNNKDQLLCLQEDKIISQGQKYFSLMDDIVSKKIILSKNTMKFIPRLFSVFVPYFDSSAAIVLSEDVIETATTIEL